jgi:hypothetical protein
MRRNGCGGSGSIIAVAGPEVGAAAAALVEEEGEKVFGVTFRLACLRSAIIFCSRNLVCMYQKANIINFLISTSKPKCGSNGLQDFASFFSQAFCARHHCSRIHRALASASFKCPWMYV